VSLISLPSLSLGSVPPPASHGSTVTSRSAEHAFGSLPSIWHVSDFFSKPSLCPRALEKHPPGVILHAMDISGRQFTLDFDGTSNPVRERMGLGEFQVFLEVDSPPSERMDTAVARLGDFAASIPGNAEHPVGVAVTDRLESVDGMDAAEFAAEGLPDYLKRSSLVFVSGRGRSFREMEEAVGAREALGFRNVVAVTGDGYPPLGEAGERRFSDSVHAIRKMSESGSFHIGCVANPFKYLSSDLFPQLFKLVKKINLGAEFVVIQAGWDMLKLRDLRWFLNSRDIIVPMVARIILLSPERVESIVDGKEPGIFISRDFRAILEGEGRHGFGQFASAQWRRLQLQVAGCRALGFSGVQISGVESPEHVATAVAKIDEGLREFDTFDSWLAAYSEHLARADMAPDGRRFALYKNSLEDPARSRPIPASEGVPPPSALEKARYRASQALLSEIDEFHPAEKKITKTLLAGCLASCQRCRLTKTHFVCPMSCSKGLSNGPCGGAKLDGSCELSPRECVHARRVRLAHWLNELDIVEELYVPHPDETA